MTHQPHRSRRGATYFDVTASVAIIGVTSSIAIPSYRSYVDKTEASERFVVTDGLCKEVVGEELAPFVTLPYMDAAGTFDVDTPASASPLEKVNRWRDRMHITAKTWKKGKYWVINGPEGTLCIGAYDADGDGGFGLYYEGGSLNCTGREGPVASTLDIGVMQKDIATMFDTATLSAAPSPCTIQQELFNRKGTTLPDGASAY